MVEGAETDRQKKWVSTLKATTACTLRLTEHWHGKGKVIIGDSWFGSKRTVEELLARGLFAVMCVKTGSAGFPKKELLDSMRQRGDTKFYESRVVFQVGGDRTVTKKIFAGAHMDKQPLLLCASTGTSLPDDRKVRNRAVFRDGEIQRDTYYLDQPEMHATYRQNFNTVDKFNRHSGQPGTLPDTWQTTDCRKRLFATSWSWIDTNAQVAWNFDHPGETLSNADWYLHLSEACAANPFRAVVPQAVSELAGHDGPFKSTCRACWVCGWKTLWKCGCERPVCRSQTRAGKDGVQPLPRLCFKEHLALVAQGDANHIGSPQARRGRAPQG